MGFQYNQISPTLPPHGIIPGGHIGPVGGGGAVSTDFVTTWETTGPSETITLPLRTGYTYNFNVDWGDGSDDDITAWDQAETTHTYTSANTYTVTITGTCQAWYFNNGGDKTKIKDVSQWGDVGFTSLLSAFYGCTAMTVTATDVGNFTSVDTFQNCFRSCSSLTNLVADNWDTAASVSCTDMFNAAGVVTVSMTNWKQNFPFGFFQTFNGCSALTTLDMSGWTGSSGATNCTSMFSGCTSLDAPNLSNLINSNATDLDNMFKNCSSMVSITGLASWDVSNVTSMSAMFEGCTVLVDLSGMNGWDVGTVNNFQTFCYNCPGLTTFDGSSWNTIAATNMGAMFRNTNITTYGVSGWNMSNVTTAVNMFLDSNFGQTEYEAVLTAWSLLSVQSSVDFHAGTAKYSPAYLEEKLILTDAPNSWTITDGGSTLDNLMLLETGGYALTETPDFIALETAYLLQANFGGSNYTFADGDDVETNSTGSVQSGALEVAETSTGTIEIASNEFKITHTGSWNDTILKKTGGFTKALGQLVKADIKKSDANRNGYIAVHDAANCYTTDRNYQWRIHADNLKAEDVDTSDTISAISASDNTYYSVAILLGGYDSSGNPYESGDTKSNFTYGCKFLYNDGSDWIMIYDSLSGNVATQYFGAQGVTTPSIMYIDNVVIADADATLEAMMEVDALDKFAGSSGTGLGAHTMDVGSGWTEQNGTFEINGSGSVLATGSSPGGPLWVATFDSGLADVYIRAKVTSGTTDNFCGAVIRYVADSDMFVFGFHNSDDTAVLMERSSGSWSTRASSALTIANSTQYQINVSAVGALIKGWVAGVKLEYGLATAGETAELHGVRLYDTAESMDEIIVWGSGAALTAVDNY